MKKVLVWCWTQIKKPLVQFVCILVLLIGYWTWDITIVHDGEETKVVMEAQRDSVSIDERFDGLEEYNYIIPERMEQMMPDTARGEGGELEQPPALESPPAEDIEDMSDREYYAYIIDVVLGHLSSILASIAALCTPIITWYFQKKKK